MNIGATSTLIEISVFTHKTIVHGVNSLRTQATLLDRRPVGARRRVRTAENVERFRQAMLWSLISIELGVVNRSVRRILHEDLHFQPYKLVFQKLKPGHYVQVR